jgi:hypothetical protein
MFFVYQDKNGLFRIISGGETWPEKFTEEYMALEFASSHI